MFGHKNWKLPALPTSKLQGESKFHNDRGCVQFLSRSLGMYRAASRLCHPTWLGNLRTTAGQFHGKITSCSSRLCSVGNAVNTKPCIPWKQQAASWIPSKVQPTVLVTFRNLLGDPCPDEKVSPLSGRTDPSTNQRLGNRHRGPSDPLFLTETSHLDYDRWTKCCCYTNGGFLEWWYPQIIHFRLGFSFINNPAMGVPPSIPGTSQIFPYHDHS